MLAEFSMSEADLEAAAIDDEEDVDEVGAGGAGTTRFVPADTARFE